MNVKRYADKVARRLHGMINEKRRNRGVSPLRGRTLLIEAATRHSRVMARNGNLFHNGPDGSPQKRAPRGYRQIAENCAMCQRSSSTGKVAGQLLSQWMKSKQHRKNLLDSRNKYDGIGIWVSGSKVYATHLMARREGVTRKLGTPGSLPGSQLILQVIQAPARIIPPYSIRERQVFYGLFWGSVAFLGSVLRRGIQSPNFGVADLTAQTNSYLLNQQLRYEQTDFGLEPLLQFVAAFPTLAVAFVAVLCGITISGTTRPRYLLENTVAAGGGFVIVTGAANWIIREELELQQLYPSISVAAIGCVAAWITLWTARNAPR